MKRLILSIVTVIVTSLSLMAQADMKDRVEKSVQSLDNQNLVRQLNDRPWTWLFTTPQVIIDEVIRRAGVEQQRKNILIELSKEIRTNRIRAEYVAETITLFLEKLNLSTDELDNDTLHALTIINTHIFSNIDYFSLRDRTIGATRKLLSQSYSKTKNYSVSFLFKTQSADFYDGYGYPPLFEESIRNDAIDRLFEQMNNLSEDELFSLSRLFQDDPSAERFYSVLNLLFSKNRVASIEECTKETLTDLTSNTRSENERWNRITVKWAKVCARFTNNQEFVNLLNAVRDRAKELDPFDYPRVRNGAKDFLGHLEYLRLSKD